MRVNTVSLYSSLYHGSAAVTLPFGNARTSGSGFVNAEYADLRVFHHHIYEYKKGIRNLILTTEKDKYRDTIERRLQKEQINYVIHEVGNGKINVYFGDKPCIEVVKTLNPRLNEQTPEEDFMLGIMLGYDKVRQCDRYLNKRNKVIALKKS